MDWKSEKGLALVVVLLVTTVLFLLGSALLSLAVTEKKIASNQIDEVKALNIAEAGVEMVLNELKKDPKWEPTWSGKFLFEGVYTTLPIKIGDGELTGLKISRIQEVPTDPLLVKIISTGIVKRGNVNIEKKLEVKVEIVNPFKLDFGQGVSVSSGRLERLVVTGNPTINGNLSFPADVELSGNMTLLGALYSKGNITINTSVNLGSAYSPTEIWAAGNIINDSANSYAVHHPFSKVDIPSFPQYDQNWFYNAATEPVIDATSEPYALTLNPYNSIDKKIIFVNGDLHIKGTYKGKGTIVVNGNVTITDSLMRQLPNSTRDSLFIISYGNIQNAEPLNDQMQIEAVFLCYQDMTVTDKTLLNGAIVTENLYLNGTPSITFNENLVSNPPTGSPLQVVSWREMYDY